MRRAVGLLVFGGLLLLVGCASTVDGRARADGAAVRSLPTTSPTADPAETGPATPGDTTTAAAPTPASTTSVPAPASTSPTSTSAGPGAADSATLSTDTPPLLPPGFYGADTDLGYRPMTTDEFDCAPDQVSGCFGILVFSVEGCPPGATVTVGIFDKAVDPTNPIGAAIGVTPAIAAGGIQPVVIADSTGVDGQLTARIQSVTC
ncbi:MAG: hypothetical protein ABIR83_14575 [Nakamurella sp.]